MLAVCEKHTPKQHSSFLKSCMEFRGNIFDFLKSSNLKVYCPEHIYIYKGIAIVVAISIFIFLKHIYIVSRGIKRLPRLPTCHCHGAQRPCWSPTSVEHLRWCHSHSSDSTVYNEISSWKGLKWIFTIKYIYILYPISTYIYIGLSISDI